MERRKEGAALVNESLFYVLKNGYLGLKSNNFVAFRRRTWKGLNPKIINC